MASARSKVVLIGWDAADWQMIEPLMERGLMPTLKQFISEGVMGNLSTMQPVLSPILWNTIATGKVPAKHGIFGFIEPNADANGVQPVTSTSRTTKALWNIVSQNELRSAVVGWYASHPAEPVGGAIVSDRLTESVFSDSPESPLPALSFYPPSLEDRLFDLRVFPNEITAAQMVPFVPLAAQIPPEKTMPLVRMQRILAKCGTTHAVFTELLENQSWDFAAAYYDTIDHFGHLFMPFHPPRMDHVPKQEFEWYSECMNGIYRFHDMMLERILKLVGPDATVVIISDHGFLNNESRPRTLTMEEDPAAWHRSHGIFAARGPGLRKGERIHGASIIDVAPTILTILEIPVAKDMDGKVLLGIFEESRSVERIASWDAETGPGNAGVHPSDLRVDPYEQAASLQQLVELGYIAAPSTDARKAVENAQVEASYNLALSEFEASPIKALHRAIQLQAQHPDRREFAILKLQAEIASQQYATANQTFGPGGVNFPEFIGAAKLAMLGTIASGLRQHESALNFFTQAGKLEPYFPQINVLIGDIHARMRQWETAVDAYERAKTIDPESSYAYSACARIYLRQGEYENALDQSLAAVELVNQSPEGYFRMGIALLHLGLNDRAVASLEMVVHIRPDFVSAHRCLALAYWRLGLKGRSAEHRNTVLQLCCVRKVAEVKQKAFRDKYVVSAFCIGD